MKNRVRAIIVQNSKILLIKRVKPEIVYWVIPGGGVEEGETIESALQRECLEELGVEVAVGEPIFEIASRKIETIGQQEFFCPCIITGGALGSGVGPEYQKDTNYAGRYILEWVDIKNLFNYDLKPAEIKEFVYKKYSKLYG